MFSAHWDLLTTVGGLCIVEQAMEYFGVEDMASPPTKHKPPENIAEQGRAERANMALQMLKEFLLDSNYLHFEYDPTADPVPKPQDIEYVKCGVTKSGQYLMAPKGPRPDAMENYARNLCHWTLQLLEMHDTAKEGDVDRLILNCKCNIPLFYSHSKLSKYYVENLDFVLKAEHLSSPQMRSRILEGAFINIKGGNGNNIEADLVQEHSVCNRKELVRALGANKTEEAIHRVTMAADHVDAVTHALQKAIFIKRKSDSHTGTISKKDIQSIKDVFREIRPFRHTPGRPCVGFQNIYPDPTMRIYQPKFKELVTNNIKRLSNGLIVEVEEEEDPGLEPEVDFFWDDY